MRAQATGFAARPVPCMDPGRWMPPAWNVVASRHCTTRQAHIHDGCLGYRSVVVDADQVVGGSALLS
jgi:hypothetical protein